MRERGDSLQAIADALNADGVPTRRGGALLASFERAGGARLPSPAATAYRRPAAARQAAWAAARAAFAVPGRPPCRAPSGPPPAGSRPHARTPRPAARRQRSVVTAVIESYGALGVFLLMVPESACVPIPSEVTLIFSGVAVHQGWMSFPLGRCSRRRRGNLVGSLLAYALGASGRARAACPSWAPCCAAGRACSTVTARARCSPRG